MNTPLTLPGACALSVTCTLLVGLPASGALGASEYDGKYIAEIRCDIIPGLTTRPLRTEFSLKITDGRAQYEREALQPDSKIPAGVTERGSGAVTPSGEVTLNGSATGRSGAYDATYRGQLSGKALVLKGTQKWRLPDGGTHVRPCGINASRSD
jgi:hypothetical protein